MQFHSLLIRSVRPVADEAVAVQLDIPDALKDTFSFLPGQYLTLRATISGEDVRRSYSICSMPKDGLLEVGIKRVEEGRFSNFAAVLKEGDRLEVAPPEGRFTCDVEEEKHILLCAAGSGITPCLSIAQTVLTEHPTSRVTLLYGNRTIRSMMFRQELDALKDSHMERLSLWHILSRENQDHELANGRLTGDKCRRIFQAKLVDITDIDEAFLCGPDSMIDDVAGALEELGLEKSQIKREFFASSQPATPRPAKAQHGDGQAHVIIRLDGVEKTVPVDPAQQTILDAAHKEGLDLPYSCAAGMCCTCRCKVEAGAVTMDSNFSLQDWELEAGYVLACQARPQTKTVTLDFDAV